MTAEDFKELKQKVLDLLHSKMQEKSKVHV
jgi:hypothetical protein